MKVRGILKMAGESNVWEEKKHNIRGIKIRNFNFTMIVLTCIIYVMLLFLTMNTYKKYQMLETATQNYIVCQQLAEQVRGGSDYLTEQVRFYAETGKTEYMEAYFTEVNETRRRDLALEQLMQAGVDGGLEGKLSEALHWSNELMKIECYSMRMTAEAYGTDMADWPEEIKNVVLSEADAKLNAGEKEKKGRTLLFDDTYSEHKDNIYVHLNTLVEDILSQTQGRITEGTQSLSQSLSKQRVMITILFILNLIMFSFIIILVIRPLQIYIGNVRNDTLFDIVGSYEFKYLALTYNSIYEVNAENKTNLQYKAEHDKLTGVLNRSVFDSLTRYPAKSKIPMALLIIDVDKFKTVNDTYGHEVGDAVLKKVAHLLECHTRSNDKVIRYGGDEFVVIMTEMMVENAHVIRRKITELNQILMNPTDGLPAVSLSVGAAFAEAGYDAAVFKKADEALYQVKKGGRCNCGFAEGIDEQSDH